jgi:hypothetical protein
MGSALGKILRSRTISRPAHQDGHHMEVLVEIWRNGLLLVPESVAAGAPVI